MPKAIITFPKLLQRKEKQVIYTGLLMIMAADFSIATLEAEDFGTISLQFGVKT